jgi:hypothetical protein
VSKVPRARVELARHSASARGKRAEKSTPATTYSPILAAGNRAVAGLLSQRAPAIQRYVGWKDAYTKTGYGWNADERAVGKIRRIPLEGLGAGLKGELASRRVWDKTAKKWSTVIESTKISALSPETASKGKAIVLVPEALDATKPIEVVVFLHGHTEGTHRPFAGWRTLVMRGKPTGLRQGIDAGDVAPVRDVALDQAPQQLEESGQTQTVIVLPQGGLHSQFGKAGDYTFSAKYVDDVVKRLKTENVWKDAKKQPVANPPAVARVTMAGHSGAGATLAGMANKKPGIAAIAGDLVILDAINGPGELGAFKAWTRARLDEALAVIKDTTKDEAAKLAYLRKAPKLRGYFTAGYQSMYHLLDDDIVQWFSDNDSELGVFAPCLRANFTLAPIGLQHEELMRGAAAGTARGKAGNILDALVGLHPPARATTADCPAMPAPLSGRKPKPKAKPKLKAKPRARARATAKIR